MKRSTLFIIAAVFLFLMFVLGTVVYKGGAGDRAARMADVNRPSLVRAHSPVLGRPDAPVEIVEFLDPACETCRAFYPIVKDLMAAHPGRIRVVLRWAPFHKGSDQVVAILEAARRQGKLWSALEALLAGQDEWSPNHAPQVARVWKHLEGLGLDLERVRADMVLPEVTAVVAQDLADARRLEVSKTPEFFVNGKPLPSFGAVQLRTLVEEAVTATRQR